MNPLSIFSRNPISISPEEILDFQPMTELEHFVSRTRTIVDGLDNNIAQVESEINMLVARLADLQTIREAQRLALEHMEGGL